MARFVLCLENDVTQRCLSCARSTRFLTDAQAAKYGQLRVIDESGVDYLYPEEYFVPVKLPPAAEKAVLREM